jgi:hypothetical protein
MGGRWQNRNAPPPSWLRGGREDSEYRPIGHAAGFGPCRRTCPSATDRKPVSGVFMPPMFRPVQSIDQPPRLRPGGNGPAAVPRYSAACKLAAVAVWVAWMAVSAMV